MIKTKDDIDTLKDYSLSDEDFNNILEPDKEEKDLQIDENEEMNSKKWNVIIEIKCIKKGTKKLIRTRYV